MSQLYIEIGLQVFLKTGIHTVLLQLKALWGTIVFHHSVLDWISKKKSEPKPKTLNSMN